MKIFDNLSLRAKLMSCFGLIIVLVGITGAIGFWALVQTTNQARELYDNNIQSGVYLDEIQRGVWELRYGFGNFISADEAARKKILDDEAKWYKLVDDNARSAAPLMDTEKEKAAFKYWLERYDAYVKLRPEWFRLVLAGRLEEAATYSVANTTPRGAENVEAIETLVVVQRDDATELIDSLSATSSRARIIFLGIAGLSLVLGVVVGWYMAQTISKATTAIAGALSDVSRGNVGTEISVESRDELGAMARSYGEMRSYLAEMANSASLIAVGDLSAAVVPKSANDVLGNSFVEMRSYLANMAQAASSVAEGDLSVAVRPKSAEDTLGTSFAAMIEKLSNLVGDAQTSAAQLAHAKAELGRAAEQAAQATQGVAQTTSQVAQGTSQQASSIQEVTQAVDQLAEATEGILRGARTQATSVEAAVTLGGRVSTAVEQMSDSAIEASAGAREATEAAQNGAAMVSRAVEGIARIKNTVEATSDEILRLGGRSQEIGKIVSVIDDIAAQTNLLALNAAIEAARAGEQGRGFAVVADEVRKLAERVATATKEIADLIGGVQAGVDRSVQVMQAGSSDMQAGSQQAAEAGEALQKILTAVERMDVQISQIASGSRDLKSSGAEMLSAIQEARKVVDQNLGACEAMQATTSRVNDAISTIASVAEQNSAATEEVSASAEEMSAQVQQVTASTYQLGLMAESLQQQVSRFKLADSGTQKPNDLTRVRAA